MISVPSSVRRLASTALLAGALLATTAATASAAYDPADPVQQAAYTQAFDLGTQAYEYGIPLLDMQRTYASSTSVNVQNGRGGGPVNQFSHFAKLADANDRVVVLPNNDTLYSMAWLDLRKQPIVVHSAPVKGRFHTLELLTPWTENFAIIGPTRTAHPDGDYLLTGPGFTGKVPRGLRRIRSPYTRVWVIGRTEINGPSDLKATQKAMRTFHLTPLNRWNARKPYGYTPPKPKRPDTTINLAHVPGTGAGEDPATFFDALGTAMTQFKAPAADAPFLAKIAALHIGPGMKTTASGLSDAQLQGLRDAVSKGPDTVQRELTTRYINESPKNNGWLVLRTGSYGTDYAFRAGVDKAGLGAPLPELAVYPAALRDRDLGPLTGEKRFVVHFPASAFPIPVQFFWSLTLYDTDGFLVPNPINRYIINDRSKLHFNADKSLDIYVQQTAPTSAVQQQNWLPAPAGGFKFSMRLYGLSAKGITGLESGTGWKPPTILPCLDTGATREGVACAG